MLIKRKIGKSLIIENFNIALSEKTRKQTQKSVDIKIRVAQFN